MGETGIIVRLDRLEGIIVRSLLLTPLPFTSDSALRVELQAFDDVRALQMEALRHGILIVHFYDLRPAESAFAAIRSMHHHFPQVAPASPGLLSSRPISAHYVLPSSSSIPDAHNQGTLVVFNLNPHLSTDHLRRLFHPFDIAKDLSMNVLAVRQVYDQLGCKLIRQKSSLNGLCATLSVPLTFPPELKQKKRKR